MRADWDQTEPIALTPEPHQQLQQHLEMQQQQEQEQHHQQQQPQQSSLAIDSDSTSMVGSSNPLQLTATPVWGSITDRVVVKEEPHEDRNNDSGISPDHNTNESISPNRFLAAGNCSLSSGSSASQDSTNMQINSFDFSIQRTNKRCNSPLDFEPSQDQSAPSTNKKKHLSGSASKRSTPELNDSIEVSPDPLQCPLCTFSTQSRLHFTEHLASHCTSAASLDAADFRRSVMDQLTNGGNIGSPEDMNRTSPPLQNDRSWTQDVAAMEDEPGLRVPRVNSQGKVKTFRCKQCSFVAITKLDFWEHTRDHIKAEKLLTCPKCPFVTEYKHHLEYHLRNHFGSKPYKCDKCSYSCVNKSMLNSHLKSHSNIYQFRCADCAYATKYCHSLKLHLRKYEHKPAMVLNADGSPNPLPIIDVYGTRRGPKAKPKKDTDQQQQSCQQQQQGAGPSVQNGLVNGAMTPLVPQQGPMVGQFQFNAMPKINGLNPFNGLNMPGTSNGMAMSAMSNLMGFPFHSQLFNTFPLANQPIPLVTNPGVALNEGQIKQIEQIRSIIEYTNNINNGTANGFSQGSNGVPINNEIDNNETSPVYNGSSTSNETSPQMSVIKQDNLATESHESNILDLSKPEQTSHESTTESTQMVVNNNNNNNTSAKSETKSSGTSRRKGRAFKLDRRNLEKDSDEEIPEKIQQEQKIETPPPSSSPVSTDSKDSMQTSGSGRSSRSSRYDYHCQYCEISFGNEVMHTVHMGYHGFQNPYTCNMCGTQSTDKLSFFMHITRSKH